MDSPADRLRLYARVLEIAGNHPSVAAALRGLADELDGRGDKEQHQ